MLIRNVIVVVERYDDLAPEKFSHPSPLITAQEQLVFDVTTGQHEFLK